MNFAIGTLLLLGFSLYFNWFLPIDVVNFWEDPIEAFKVFILPATTMGIVVLLVDVMTRSAFLETMTKILFLTARAKGTVRTIVIGHAFRNSSILIVTIAGMQIGYLLAVCDRRAAILDSRFGPVHSGGIYQRDYPVVQGGVLFVALVFVLVNLLIDLIYTWIGSARIKYWDKGMRHEHISKAFLGE